MFNEKLLDDVEGDRDNVKRAISLGWLFLLYYINQIKEIEYVAIVSISSLMSDIIITNDRVSR